MSLQYLKEAAAAGDRVFRTRRERDRHEREVDAGHEPSICTQPHLQEEEERMSIPATGYVVRNESGQDIVIERTFRAPIEDVWANIVDPERITRWIGTWSGYA